MAQVLSYVIRYTYANIITSVITKQSKNNLVYVYLADTVILIILVSETDQPTPRDIYLDGIIRLVSWLNYGTLCH